MSWFIGGIGKFQMEFLDSVQEFVPPVLVKTFSEEMFLIAGGIPNTCKYEVDHTGINKKKWIQVGIGISQDTPKRFLSNSDWQKIVDYNNEEKIEIDGHYVLASWDPDRFIFVTDKLGLRDFYYCTDNKGNILFSTRIDWLARFVNTEIDFKEFGSRWLLFNQISTNSILKNVTRVVCGSVLQIDRITKQTFLRKNNWLPQLNGGRYSTEEFSEDLNSLITFPLSGNKLSLSLSGGLDSRVIFSYLLHQKNNWDTHSFGSINHPDFVVAKRIADNFKIKHNHLDSPAVPADEFLNELKEYSGQTVINTAASSFSQLGHYKRLQNSSDIIIDGCPGEIWRRQFFNRLSYFGKKFILKRDYKNIIKLISYYKADIFNKDVNEIMQLGCEEQLEMVYEIIPPPEIIGVENWIDLFAIKTRYPNYFLHEQSRTDSIVLSFMPFTQISIIDKLLLLDLSLKTNAKLFKRIISLNERALEKYPLVKGNITHPFWMTPLQTRLWSLILKKTRPVNKEIDLQTSIINRLTDFINDISNSKSVLENKNYDAKKIIRLANSLNKGEITAKMMGELDWWLSLELFNQQICAAKI